MKKLALTLKSLFPLLGILLLLSCEKAEIKTKITTRTVVDTLNLDPALVAEGKDVFRYDTFGDEVFWTDVMHIDKAILGEDNGGYGAGVSPATALSVGMKVDAEALPAEVVEGIQNGEIDLNDPATTVELLRLNSVVGVMGSFDDEGDLSGVGITCAFCHSTVDNSFSAGIGSRLDGHPNRDLNVGAIIGLSDNLQALADLLHVDVPTVSTVLAGWGPGRYNAVLNMDGVALRPDGQVAANLIPAAFGLQGVNLTTYTGWGDMVYWNAYVGVTQMRGQGNFFDPRLNDAAHYPIAVENNLGNVVHDPDLVSPILPALHAYQLSIPAPIPPEGSYDAEAAERGMELFNNAAQCATCHVPPTFTDSGHNLHTAEEIGIDDFEASRSPTGMYRTTPLRGLSLRMQGGLYHDGRFATLNDVVNHYNDHFDLQLTADDKSDLVEYLKSI